MEAYSSTTTSSSSTQAKDLKMPQSFQSALHTIRKPQVKPWKKPIAPLPPTPTKIYKVHPMNFRDLVQKLTGLPGTTQLPNHPPSHQTTAPLPPGLDFKQPIFNGRVLSLIPLPASEMKSVNSSHQGQCLTVSDRMKVDEKPEDSISLESILAPSSHGWCSFPILSPGSLSMLEQSAVL